MLFHGFDAWYANVVEVDMSRLCNIIYLFSLVFMRVERHSINIAIGVTMCISKKLTHTRHQKLCGRIL